MQQDNLVIVESPAKAKTIEKFLGGNFIVKSSFGHIRDLSKKELGIQIGNDFTPEYEIPADKKKVVEDLRKLAKGVKTVWLASDEDREGEAIAWHLATVLDLPLDTTKRIVFHEITKPAILGAIEKPRTIDMNLVDAQQARRVLDRLVGFELSPILWKKVKPSLSAGRVQSVAVRLLVEREREIIAFNPTTSFRIVAEFFSPENKKVIFRAEYSRHAKTREEAMAILESLKDATFSVEACETKPSQRNPAPPFTTSTLQQEAGRKLGMPVSRTMSIAQHLYEQGLITYMRTDSVNLSQLAINTCKQEISEAFGQEYSHPRNFTTNSKGAQEAHEAIRPTYIANHTIEGTAPEKRLYELIWKRTVASQMVAAKIDKTVITIGVSNSQDKFVASGDTVVFDGFLKLYTESSDEAEAQKEETNTLPKVSCGDELSFKNIQATERYTQAPVRYDEASLVKKMEELGIGRPSTYAPTITTIKNRGYVDTVTRAAQKRDIIVLTLASQKITEKTTQKNYGAEKNRLAPTDIGIIVNDYLEQYFTNIIDYNFTANVEKEFDQIADGKVSWNKMISNFYGPFHEEVTTAIHTQVEKSSQQRILGTDPKSGMQVKARIGRYGPMVEIEVKEGEKPRFASLKKGQLIESITLEEALELFALPRTVGQFEGDDLVVGIGKFGSYVRYGKNFASLAKDDDPYTVTLDRLCEIVAADKKQRTSAATPLRSFPENPDVVIKNGRYGAYIASQGKNYRIPKGKKAETLTLEECLHIIANTKK